MQLIAIAPKDLFCKEDWKKIEKHFSSICFVDKNKIKSFDYNLNDDEKTLLIDPDFID